MDASAVDDPAAASVVTRAQRSTALARSASDLHRRARLTGAAAVLTPMAVALVLGLSNITRQHSMWRDESVTVQVAGRSVPQILDLLHHVDLVHGAYYLLMHVVFDVAGSHGLVVLRLPSVLAYALAAGVVAAIAKRLAGPRTALLAGLVYACLPISLKYAQEGRSYALVACGVAIASYFFLRGITDSRRRWWFGYALALVVSVLLNEFALLVLLANAITLWLLRARRPVVYRWVIAGAATVIVTAPLVLASRSQKSEQLHWLHRPHLWDWLLFVLVSVAVLAIDHRTRRGAAAAVRLAARFALPLFIAPTLTLLVVSEVSPVYVDRYVLYGYVGLAVYAGVAVDRAITATRDWSHRLRVVSALVVVAALVAVLVPWWTVTGRPTSRKDDVLAIQRQVSSIAQPGEPVIFLPSRRREWLLTDPSLLNRLDDVALRSRPAELATLEGTEVSTAEIGRRMAALDRVLVLEDWQPGLPHLDSATDRAVKRILGSHFTLVHADAVPGGRVATYARTSA